MSERGFAILGLGYVGLPVALAFARHFSPVIGFDVSKERVSELKSGEDRSGEVAADALRQSTLRLTDDPEDLAEASFFIVAVPTPIDGQRRPDLRALESACKVIGPRLKPGRLFHPPSRRNRHRQSPLQLHTGRSGT